MRRIVRSELTAALGALRAAGWAIPDSLDISLDSPRNPAHGDLATNVAMALAKPLGKPPREIAQALASEIALNTDGAIASAEIAGPGFLNLRVRPHAWHDVIGDVLARGDKHGHAEAMLPGRVLVEFVSANPTGPLHVAHARGAVVGDALVRVMRAAGQDVATEYYVNDAGQKVVNLAWTVRALLHGQDLWSDAYRGEYVHALAESLRATHPGLVADPLEFRGEGDARAPVPHAGDRALAAACVAASMSGIRRTLDRLGLSFAGFFSEQSLVDNGSVPRLVEDWQERGLAERRDGAVFFRSAAAAEEDKDRVLRKSSGDYTYFATDIVYHADKLGRGFTSLIDVWGADHHGYIPRMRNALEAMGLPRDAFEVLLMQMVSLVKEGQPYRMSKTTGTFVTIDEILDEIDAAAGSLGAGRDALRYFLLQRSSDSPMEIDIDLAKRQSVENPVFYAQYAHARMCQIEARALESDDFSAARARGLLFVPPGYDRKLAERLSLGEEKDLLALCDRFPEIVREAATARAPHRVLFFVQEMAQAFASYYTRLQKVHHDAILPQRGDREREDWIDAWDWEKTRARLLWLRCIRQTHANALHLLGIDAPTRMARVDVVVGTGDEAPG